MRIGKMTDLSKLSKDELKSEMNAMDMVQTFNSEDLRYRQELEKEYWNRVEDECKEVIN
jgi:hypothetical protein